MFKLRLVTNTLCILSLAIAFPAMAGIGSITDMKGDGQIKRGIKVTPAGKGSGVEKMDTVSTNSQGKVRITFNDATTVNITENSRLLIDDFVYDGGNQSKGRLGLKVALGTVRYASGAVAHGNPSGVNIRTPTATIAVRGTDFVMSVDEVGRSTVVLIPSCFDEKDTTRTTFDCPSGAIDVITASGVITMNKPFQATVVESTFAPPAPPVIVNPALKALNNSIQISPLSTDDGQSLLKVAREALKKYTNPSKSSSDNNKDPDLGTSDSVDQVAFLLQPRQATPAELEKVYIEYNGELPKEPIHTNVSPTYKKQVQEGWVYARMSDDKNQLVGVWVPKDSTAMIVSSQNGVVDSYNFMEHKWTTSGTGRPQGSITIIQNSAPAN
jgi:hypothetical protein